MAICPKLIYVSISAYGEHGSMRDRPGYDPVLQAESGMMAMTGEPDGRPMRTALSLIDTLTAGHATSAVCAAIDRARKDRPGRLPRSRADGHRDRRTREHGLWHGSVWASCRSAWGTGTSTRRRTVCSAPQRTRSTWPSLRTGCLHAFARTSSSGRNSRVTSGSPGLPTGSRIGRYSGRFSKAS